MAARDIAGTVRAVTIEGITFRAAGDTNISQIFTGWENTLVASSGRPMRKMVKRIQAMESVILLTNMDERQILKTFAEQLDELTLSMTNAAGDVMKSQGTIEVETHETEENRTTVQLLPTQDWTPFVGS